MEMPEYWMRAPCLWQLPFRWQNRRVTNAIDFLIFDSFRDFNLSASQIAARFNVSDTYAIRVFDRYVDLPRLKLTSALCIDEVDLSIGRYKYALVIQDFFTGEPVDMVISRRNEITEPYFADIPKKSVSVCSTSYPLCMHLIRTMSINTFQMQCLS